jgi:hypothetical protein
MRAALNFVQIDIGRGHGGVMMFELSFHIRVCLILSLVLPSILMHGIFLIKVVGLGQLRVGVHFTSA